MEGLLWRQLVCLPQSAVVGFGLGVLLDLNSGYWRGKSYRHFLFVFDLLWCVFSALVAFFAALVIADGQLHPTIFIGLLLGALTEHIALGRWLSALAWRIHSAIRFCFAVIRRICGSIASRAAVRGMKNRKMD